MQNTGRSADFSRPHVHLPKVRSIFRMHWRHQRTICVRMVMIIMIIAIIIVIIIIIINLHQNGSYEWWLNCLGITSTSDWTVSSWCVLLAAWLQLLLHSQSRQPLLFKLFVSRVLIGIRIQRRLSISTSRKWSILLMHCGPFFGG